MYKKVYVEITNACNLNCSFCMHNRREVKYLEFDEFKIILSKLKGYTKYLYLHVLGEPTLHPHFKKFVDYAVSEDFNINLTTNGYLINRISDVNNLRQINISLHSFIDSGTKSLDDYMNDVFMYVDSLDKTYVSFRLWVNSPFSKEIMSRLNDHYGTSFNFGDEVSFKLSDRVYLDTRDEFEWPTDSNYLSDVGTCYALRDHIGILVSGDVVPCCLDGDARIKLGNIFNDDLESIINSSRYQDMLKGFKENKKIEELCKKCHFIEK